MGRTKTVASIWNSFKLSTSNFAMIPLSETVIADDLLALTVEKGVVKLTKLNVRLPRSMLKSNWIFVGTSNFADFLVISRKSSVAFSLLPKLDRQLSWTLNAVQARIANIFVKMCIIGSFSLDLGVNKSFG